MIRSVIHLTNFKALLAKNESETIQTAIEELTLSDLPTGECLIKVHYSSVNYKDALATKKGGGVVRNYPMIPGIDLSGEIVSSTDANFNIGDKVLVTGYQLGTAHFGGFSEYACVPSKWIVPLPTGLTLKEAMIIGTAGFTAALSIHALEQNPLTVTDSILVTGATGGVGSMAIAMLNKLGYQQITAASRKATASTDYLHNIGATTVTTPAELQLEKIKPLEKQLWQGIIDPVGGHGLTQWLAQLSYGGTLALSGNTGGLHFDSTVLPFILRGIHLTGIDSVSCPMALRKSLWNRLATTMKPDHLEMMIDNEITLNELPTAFNKILSGEMTGRTLVKIH